MEIPVYLFTGFLEAGKTKFIQEALEGADFNAGERTLLLVCEEGVEEYRPESYFAPNVFQEMIEEEDDLNPDLLASLREKHKAERVIIEYNGMWKLDNLYGNYPPGWITYQEVMLADAGTFINYNDNMRQLVYDKMKSAELVAFNRCSRDAMNSADDQGVSLKERFHKIVRAANSKSQIIYEYGHDDVELDSIPDPPPYNMDADIIEIKEDQFAFWYRDMNENLANYEGRKVRVKGRAVNGGQIPEEKFIFGRHVMTCCVQDIQFAGMVCKWTEKAAKLNKGEWVMVFAEIKVEEDSIYGGGISGPVLYCSEVTKAAQAVPEVATF